MIFILSPGDSGGTEIMTAIMTTTNVLAAWTDVFVKSRFLGNTLWQWLALLGVLLGSFVIGRVVSFFLDRQGRRLEERLQLISTLLRSASRPASLVILAGGLYLAGQFMNLTYVENGVEKMDLTSFWFNVCRTIAVLAAGWFIYRLVDVVEFYLRRWTSRTETLLDDQLVPMIRKTLRVFVVIVVLLFVAQNIFNWNIGALLAGLGVGGLAFALAARDMLANLFGSITIFADRPFQMGDWVIINDQQGVIEEVGFRSTRIRLFNGHQVIMPNSVVANATIENVARRGFIRRVMNVTITYDTPPQKVQRGVEILREMLEERSEHLHPDYPPRVYFNDFNAASLNIIVYYWFVPPQWWQYNQFNHDFNMELLRRFNQEGIEFAFPTQTLYVKQDSPIEADIRLGEGPRRGKVQT